ncbi:MAG TPA: hypothetical protein VMG12_07960 [Polyangiaceae bacterium]|nr:hypothetical protein [Polyangiaceae bacterium]
MQRSTAASPASPVSLLCASLLCGCGALTREEARDALEEIEISSQAQALTSNSVELSTDFTIREGAQSAAEELRDFIAAELPCAEITLSPGQLGIEYGARPGDCSYRGQRYQGQHLINVSRNDADQVIVDHVWNALGNGRVRVDGTATVTWSRADQTRHVVHEAQWTRIIDGRTGEGSGDRLQRPLGSGFAEGFGVDGEREWRGQTGHWELVMSGVEMRWADPVPQAGRYTLDTPYDESLSATFTRTGDTRIRVTIAGKRRSFDFDVNTLSDE